MSTVKRFHSHRSRGVVWACDLAGSSKYLNRDDAAEDLEEFLTRLYWTAVMIVEAAGGRFIKWTGDGFLAWFETPLHRDLGKAADASFYAAWHLSFLVNVTQLGLKPRRAFRVRHGMAYEHDAVVMHMDYPDGHRSMDLIGRAVVLAFRFAGIAAAFPGVVTQGDIVRARAAYRKGASAFRKRAITADERLKYFKGQAWGTKDIFASTERARRPKTLADVVAHTEKAISAAESSCTCPPDSFTVRFLEGMRSGPPWCTEVLQQEEKFLRDDLLGSLKRILPIMRELKDKQPPNPVAPTE